MNTADHVAAYLAAMQAAGVPSEPLAVYDSNSWRRVGLAREYREVMAPCVASDGHPDIRGFDVLRALVAAFNAMPVALTRIAELERIVAPSQPPRPDTEAIAAVPELANKKAVVLYFETDADRDELVAAIQEVKPGMRAVNV